MRALLFLSEEKDVNRERDSGTEAKQSAYRFIRVQRASFGGDDEGADAAVAGYQRDYERRFGGNNFRQKSVRAEIVHESRLATRPRVAHGAFLDRDTRVEHVLATAAGRDARNC